MTENQFEKLIFWLAAGVFIVMLVGAYLSFQTGDTFAAMAAIVIASISVWIMYSMRTKK